MASGDGEVKIQLSENRFVTVSEFKGKRRVDIREYYLNDAGEKKPGKKGISLSLEEYKKLVDSISDINKAMGLLDDSSDSSSDSEESNEK
ncbi:Activated RNA polymerase II transcriptional coactivator p15 [Halotydeus destructor]|nr:Activated RNA polymerase II transcriptional coactivator p15 [Halotydeus destructor]